MGVLLYVVAVIVMVVVVVRAVVVRMVMVWGCGGVVAVWCVVWGSFIAGGVVVWWCGGDGDGDGWVRNTMATISTMVGCASSTLQEELGLGFRMQLASDALAAGLCMTTMQWRVG